MTILEYIIGGILLVLAIALVCVIGLQQSKRKSGLSGSIAGNGASESYLSRNKISNKETFHKKLTMILAIIFVVLVVVLYIVGSVDPAEETSDTSSSAATSSETATSSEVETSSDAETSSEAATSSDAATSSEDVTSAE